MTKTANISPSYLVAAEVRAEMARHQIGAGQLARAMVMDRGSLRRRLSGELPFTVDELYRLADIFDVAPSTLLY